MPTTNHTVTVTIDGTDRSTSLLYDALSVRVGVGNNTAVADLEVEEVSGYIPQPWDEVIVAVGSTRIFGGFLTQRVARGVSAGDSKRVRWALACRDWSALLDKIVVTASYADQTDAAIVTQLFAAYLTGNGFSLASVTYTQSGLTMGFDRVTMRQALNKLAEQVGAAWYIDSNKNFYWFNRWAPPRSAFDIDTSAPNNSTTFDVLAGSLQRTIDDATGVNRVSVYGADIQGELVTETFTVGTSGTEYEFGTLDYPVHSIASVTVNLSSLGYQTLAGDKIGYEPDATLWDSLVQAPREKWVVCNREKRTIKVLTLFGYPAALSTVTVRYYKATPVAVTVEDLDLQAYHGRVLEYQLYQPAIADTAQAEAYGNDLLATYGQGAETITFDVPEFGLAPGTEIYVYSPELGITPVPQSAQMALQNGALWLLENGDNLLEENAGLSALSQLLLENGDNWLWENSAEARTERAVNVGITGFYIVQEVRYRPVHTPTGWMIVASVTAGEYRQTLVDIVSKLTGSGAAAAAPAAQLRGRLSDVATDLGEVRAGRAVLTDGGTAAYAWGTPNAHTGVVLGLDDSGTAPVGAMYIYSAGSARVKLGNVTGMHDVGSIAPTGYGIWTDNGFFTGLVAGGTVVGASIRTSATVDSSNPGVIIDSTGLTGYGTVGIVFSIPTNPALSPRFASGTILSTTYEIDTAAVLRTGTTNPRVQIDNSGIYAYNSGGTLVTKIETTTGRLTAVDGVFSGSVTASSISGGTVSGALVSAGTVSGARVTAGTVSGAYITAGSITGVTITGNSVTGGTVSGAVVSAGTVTGAYISAGTVSGAYLTGGTVNGSNITGGNIFNGTISGAVMSGGTVTVATTLLFDYGGVEQGRLEYGTVEQAFVFDFNKGITFYAGSGGDPKYFNVQADGPGQIGLRAGNGGTVALTQDDGATISLRGGETYVNNLLNTDSIRPQSSHLKELGDSTHGWRYLYLSDGTDEWRIAINTSGVISTTKV